VLAVTAVAVLSAVGLRLFPACPGGAAKQPDHARRP